LYKSTEAVKMF